LSKQGTGSQPTNQRLTTFYLQRLNPADARDVDRGEMDNSVSLSCPKQVKSARRAGDDGGRTLPFNKTRVTLFVRFPKVPHRNIRVLTHPVRANPTPLLNVTTQILPPRIVV
jgi:hypothetical protein